LLEDIRLLMADQSNPIRTFVLSDVKLEKQFKGSLRIEDMNWQVGVIVGRSGSGKTNIAKQLFPTNFFFVFC
jgi:hypothetical protein